MNLTVCLACNLPLTLQDCETQIETTPGVYVWVYWKDCKPCNMVYRHDTVTAKIQTPTNDLFWSFDGSSTSLSQLAFVGIDPPLLELPRFASPKHCLLLLAYV